MKRIGMRPPRVAVVFDRKKVVPAKEGAYEIRIQMAGRAYYMSTGVRSRKEGMLSLADSQRIAALQTRVTDYINKCLAEGKAVDMMRLRRYAVSDGDDGGGDFLAFFRERVEHRVMADGTRKHYKTVLHALDEWGVIETFGDVTVEHIVEMDEWLHRVRGVGDSGAYTYHKVLKAIINDAVDFGKMEANPYNKMRRKFGRGERETIDYLTEAEFEQLRRLPLPEGSMLAHARDVFVFQTLTALSYSDLRAFDIRQYRHEGGRYYKVDNQREKTGKKFVTCLLSPAVEIGEKYGWRLPIVSNQKYNEALKIIGSAIGCERLHSHMARSTFATWALSKGVPVQNVSKMLGHASVTMTMRRYARILEQDVVDDFGRLDELLK